MIDAFAPYSIARNARQVAHSKFIVRDVRVLQLLPHIPVVDAETYAEIPALAILHVVDPNIITLAWICRFVREAEG